MPFDFSQQQVLVTGATSGIGEAIALAFQRAGASVLATGRTSTEVADLQGRAPELQACELDISQPAEVDQLVGKLDRLHVLVNCAGTIVRNGQEHDPERFAEVVNVNLNGTMRVCAALRPLLAQQNGAIVNTASMLSFFGSGSVPAYSASKGGVLQLTRSLALAWAEQGIRVNAIAPGWIATALTQPLVDDPQRNREIVERTPLGRWGTPHDVAGSVLFLCSPHAAFITGAVLPVDGGYLVR